MHFLASKTLSSTIALVGHESIHLVQEPQRFFEGKLSKANSWSMRILERNIHDPWSLLIKQEFLPIQPKPEIDA